jgi:hypothetical protein
MECTFLLSSLICSPLVPLSPSYFIILFFSLPRAIDSITGPGKLGVLYHAVYTRRYY